METKLNSVELFSGCGGLTLGMKKAGFDARVAVEVDNIAAKTFSLNHKGTVVINQDIRSVASIEVQNHLVGGDLHLLAGCPPCQGFSSVRRLNKRRSKRDDRNALILEYLRFVDELRPLTIMMENVPGIEHYYLFRKVLSELRSLGYWVDYKIVNIKDYGVPQSRRRLVLVGSRLGAISVAADLRARSKTVRSTIGKLPQPDSSPDWVHRIVANHSVEVQKRIQLTPKDGGSRKDLPAKYTLNCHKSLDSGFNDIYGRLRWDDVSTTITGGCLNPSKGRFLHPEQDRCISAREAAMLQSFPATYKFDKGATKTQLAQMIGNALPPRFSYVQSKNIFNHIKTHLKKKKRVDE